MSSARQTVPAVLAGAARKFAQKPWLLARADARWACENFREVYEKARYFAVWLLRQGLNAQDRVAFVAQAGPAWFAAQLGVLLAGGVCAPLSTRLLPAELRLRLDHCDPRFIIVSGAMRERVAALAEGMASPGVIVCLEEGGEAPPGTAVFPACCEAGKKGFSREELARGEARLRGSDDAFISYTPGTEGPAKAVRITHAGFLSLAAEASRAFDTPRARRILVAVPADYSCMHPAVISFSLLRGIPLFFSDEPESLVRYRPLPLSIRYPYPVFFLAEPWVLDKLRREILRAVEKRGRLTRAIFYLGLKAGERLCGDGFNSIPFGARLKNWLPYYLANRFLFSRIRRAFGCRLRFFAGGFDGVSQKAQAFFYALKIPVFQGYTLAEVSSAISCNTLEEHKLGTSGRILPGVSCRILNSGGYPTGIGEAGEICVEGPLVMKGYFKNEDATQEALRSGWLSTGDMGYVDEDGFLVVTGRKANLLAVPDGGRFSPEIIEEAILSSSPLFRQALVYCSRGRAPCALVVLDEGQLAALAEKKRFTARGEALEAVTEAFFAYTREGFWQKRIPSAWRPFTFRVLEEGFSAEAGTLNAARKMVRERIIRSSLQILESMYAAGEDSPDSEANLETVWRLIQKTLGVKV